MMTKDEALKMAIDDAITKFINDVSDDNDSDSTWQSYAMQAAEMIRIRIKNACKEALAQPSVAELNDEYLRDTYVEGLQPTQEPVAWMNDIAYSDEIDNLPANRGDIIPLYAHPTPSWQGLSDGDIQEHLGDELVTLHGWSFVQGVRWANKKLKEKNT